MPTTPDRPETTAESPVPSGETSVPLRFRDRVRLKYGSSSLLCFRVGGEWFALEIQAVEEALEPPAPRAVPDGPAALLGVFGHGDALLPLYSSAQILGVRAATSGVALVMRNGSRHVALAVDDVDEVVHVPLAELREPPHRDVGDEIVAGVCWSDGRLLTVLDARALVSACTPTGEPGA